LIVIENAIKDYDMIKGLKKKLSDEMLKELLRRLSYRYVPSGEYVFRRGISIHHYFKSLGEIEDNYYIILMGKVGIEKLKRNVPYISKELKTGDKFGDLSLSDSAENRRFSAVALEDSHLGTLDKESYLLITSSIRAQIMKQAENLLFNSFFKSEWSKYDLMRVAVHFNVHNFKRDTILYREGDICEQVYFIRSGEVESYIKLQDEEREFHEVVQKDYDNQSPQKLKKTSISIWTDFCLFGYDEFHQTNVMNSAHFQSKISVKRKTNAVVNSHTAEIWTMDVGVKY
jgi:CRP-like cAMP-binding protein